MGKEDALIFDHQDNILETSSANIFLVINGELYTPSLSQAVLPGIMRQVIIEQAHGHGLICFEDCLTREHLLQAEAVFLTNSIIGCMPVRSFDEHQYDINHSFYQLLNR